MTRRTQRVWIGAISVPHWAGQGNGAGFAHGTSRWIAQLRFPWWLFPLIGLGVLAGLWIDLIARVVRK